MSQPPNYPPTSNYASGNYVTPPARPTALTVAAVLGIVLASLSLLCNIIGIFGVIMQSAMSGQPGAVKMSPMMNGIGATMAVISLIIAITWLAVSIGLLKVAPWAISLGKKLALIHILILVLSLVVSLVVVAPETKRAAEQAFNEQQARQGSSGNSPPPGFAKGFAAGMAYGGPLIGFVIGLILPVTMLIALGRPSVQAALAANAGGATGGYSPPM